MAHVLLKHGLENFEQHGLENIEHFVQMNIFRKKKDKLLIHATTWMNLRNILLCKKADMKN